MTAPCTRDVGLVPDVARRARASSTSTLDGVSLLPGTYDLHTTVTDFNRSHIYDHLHLALRFDVMSGRPYETGRSGDDPADLDIQ